MVNIITETMPPKQSDLLSRDIPKEPMKVVRKGDKELWDKLFKQAIKEKSYEAANR